MGGGWLYLRGGWFIGIFDGVFSIRKFYGMACSPICFPVAMAINKSQVCSPICLKTRAVERSSFFFFLIIFILFYLLSLITFNVFLSYHLLNPVSIRRLLKKQHSVFPFHYSYPLFFFFFGSFTTSPYTVLQSILSTNHEENSSACRPRSRVRGVLLCHLC
jgi:hypothetical protein